MTLVFIYLICIISIYESSSYTHQYAVNPYYMPPSRSVPRNLIPYVDPKIYQTSCLKPRYAVIPPEPKIPTQYPIYEKPSEPISQIAHVESNTLSQPSHNLKLEPSNSGTDSKVLNNLAIALQLLIINNLINNPGPEMLGFNALKNSIEETKVVLNNQHDNINLAHTQNIMPNAKYLGSSNVESSLMGLDIYGTPPPSPRAGLVLRSPYDSLSTISDASSFTSSTPNKDFQSPYASYIASDNNRDLFSMSDIIY